jgi:hypothetical protein
MAAKEKPPVYGYSTKIPHALGAPYVAQLIVSRRDGAALSAEELAAIERAYPQKSARKKSAAGRSATPKRARTAKRKAARK